MGHEQVMQMIEHNEEVFEVKMVYEGTYFTAFWVFYPNCPRGDKIMVFHNSVAPQKPYKRIRPHFGEEGSPVARFEPTEAGWTWAMIFANQE